MTETAAVDALEYVVPTQPISQPNYHKIVATLRLHRLNPAPIRNLVFTVDKKLRTKTFKRYKFVNWVQHQLEM